MSNSRSQLEKFLAGLEIKAEKVLDIGGSQLPVKGRVKSWEVKEYKILDLEAPHECKIKPDIIADLNRGQDFLDLALKYEKQFDIVFCLEVAEYLLNPLYVFSMIADILKPSGILYISFHFNYPIHKPHGLDYLRYTEYGAKELLSRAGFRIAAISYKNFSRIGQLHYDNIDIVEGNKRDKDANHNTQGYIIEAIKN